MITLKQLAEQAGLSVRTVSRILNGDPHVLASKRELVLKLAADSHYVPNMAARNLRLQNHRFVGILFEHFDMTAATRQLNVLNEKLTRCGYYPVIGRYIPGHEKECAEMIHSWAGTVKYVIVMFLGTESDEQCLRNALCNLPVTMIFADCTAAPGKYDLYVDRSKSICRMINTLYRSGFRRILHCGSRSSRTDGFRLAEQTLDYPDMELPGIPAGLEIQDGYAAGPAVMQSGADAVFFDTDRAAAGFYRYAAEHRIRIPDDISVIGFDNDSFSEFLNPPLSTLAHPVNDLADYLCRIVTTGKMPDRPVLEMPFLIRGSIRKNQF